jgi:hypothetical protein
VSDAITEDALNERFDKAKVPGFKRTLFHFQVSLHRLGTR